MTRLARVTLVSLSLPLACAAQIQADYTVPSIRTEITNKSFPGEIGSFVVTNESPIAITAMHFTYGCHFKQSQVFDSLLYGLDRPIGHLQSWSSHFGSPELPRCPGGVDAAVFADGHSEGDQKAIDRIYSGRKGFYEGIDFAIPLVSDVVQSAGERPKVLSALSSKRVQIAANLGIDVDERKGETFLLGIVAEGLQDELQLATSADLDRPREPGIDAVMNTENLNHTQAAAYVLRRKLLEWQKDLEDKLSPR